MRMIQPINASSPRAVFRGSKKPYGISTKGLTNSEVALINAGGVALAAGGITTAVARSYTTSWSHAGVLGLCASFLAMFFMTPQLIEKAGLSKLSKKTETELLVKEDARKVADVLKENLKPAKKLVQFRSEQAPQNQSIG